MGKKKIDMTGYDNVPDYSGCCPDCPVCGETMGYSYIRSEFKCPECGHIMDEDDWDYEHIYMTTQIIHHLDVRLAEDRGRIVKQVAKYLTININMARV